VKERESGKELGEMDARLANEGSMAGDGAQRLEGWKEGGKEVIQIVTW
jgi:hypothetical protein